MLSKLSSGAGTTFSSSFKDATIAPARGCSDFSSAARSTFLKHSSWVCAHSQPLTVGWPSVNVPVLSSTTTFTFRICSRATASFIKICWLAALPIPTIRAVGVASPKAHGQAITNTETADSMAYEKYSVPPITIQSTKVSTAMPSTTGTKIPVTRSTIRCTGALLPCASCTMRMMRARTVSLPTCDALMMNEPRWLMVPASTLSPFFLSTGIGSPLIMLSSTKESPSARTPSTGICSPGRTTTRSSTCNWSIKISSSIPLRNTRATFGCNPMSFLIAAVVLPFARSSINLPVSTKAIITTEAS